MDPDAQAEIAALKIILALTAEHATLSGGLAERGRLVNATLTHIDEFFKGITIT